MCLLAAITVGAFVSCEYDDSELREKINDHENRIAQLEELCSQMNTNISSLQTIVSSLQDNDYVTSITPVTSGGETIGYTINFSKSGPVTIYHGEDGKDGTDGQDGEDGKDGHTPIVGVKIASDGNYYWTIDGEWLLDDEGNKIRADGIDGQDGANGSDGQDGITPLVKIENGYWYVSYDNGVSWEQLGAATVGSTPKLGIQQDTDGNYYWTIDGEWLLDEEGNKIRANGIDGQDGADGNDGQDGKDGQDGITPQLKIEDGYWYVSYDNGVQWTQLWKATGEDGKDGDSMFSNVTYDDNFVYLVLADNTTTLMIPRYSHEFSITFTNGNDLVCSAGETVSIPYTLTYGDENTDVAAIPHGGWEAAVEKTGNTSGTITVTAPRPMKDGEVIVLASDGKEKTIMRKLTFSQGVVSIVTKSYLTDSNASTINVELSTNLDYTVSIPDDAKSWISVSGVQTKTAMRNDVVSLDIAANLNDVTRSATVSFVNSANDVLNAVTVSQTGSEIANNEIWYISSDGNIIEPDTYNFSGTIVSNTYGNGRGVIVFEDNLTEIWQKAFTDTKLVEITIPDETIAIKTDAFFSCEDLITINMPTKLTCIESGAFQHCYKLYGKIIIPEGVTSIGRAAFNYCSSLIEIIIPQTVSSIALSAFSGCGNLTKINIPKNITSIEDDTFRGCNSLNEIRIPEGVISIGSVAFQECSTLMEITIPSSVTTLGYGVFDGCNNLEKLYCKAIIPPSVDMNYYNGVSVSGNTLIYVPEGSVAQYKSAEGWSQYASQIVGNDFTE